jgi:hypothetical protein
MKEMIQDRNTIRGGFVKKTLFVAVIAAMLVFAFAGSAFASNLSGQQRLGVAASAAASVAGTSTAGAGTYTYLDWNLSKGTNFGDNSPHGNFTTTTVKCVVCHAIHYAAPGGAPVSGGSFNNGTQSADTLLRMKASNACVFCHAQTGTSVNGTPVYDGTAPTDGAGGATNEGHATGTNCSLCHTGVHGVNEDNSVASLEGFLLKNLPLSGANAGPGGANTSDMIDAVQAIDNRATTQGFAAGQALGGTIGTFAASNTTVLREQAVGIFCAECHNGAYATVAAGAATNVFGGTSVAYSGHRIAAAATTNWNSTGGTSSGSQTIGSIAWKPATNCKSCHDAVDTFGNVAFPHSWGGTKMWLMSAPDAGTATTALPYGTAAGSAYNVNSPQLSDGVCLKCHVASGGTIGVGLTF